jgi:GT2 family glycosyltransferase
VAHIIKHISLPIEVVVYDNASQDGSMELLPKSEQIKAIDGNENLGFAKGNNRAARASSGAWLHFLNPDILVNQQLNSDYKRILAGPKNRLYVNSLLDSNGHAQQMQMLIPTLGNYLRRLFTPSKARYWSIGASVVMHRDTFEAIGGWCEDYFMYSEDLDLFYSAHKMGLEVVHLDTQITHIGKVSSATAWSAEQRASVIEKSVKTFYKRHSTVAEYFVVRLMQLTYQLMRRDPEFMPGAKAFFRT